MDNQSSSPICYFCNEKFTNIDEFWHHMNTLPCVEKSQNLPVAIASTNNSTSAISTSIQDLPFVPSPTGPGIKSSSQSKVLFKNLSNVVSFPNQVIQPEPPFKSRPYQKDISQQPSYSSSSSYSESTLQSKPMNHFVKTAARSSKWSCTLCSMHFGEKKDLLAHVKTAEHECNVVKDSKSPTYPYSGRSDACLNCSLSPVNCAPQNDIDSKSMTFSTATDFCVPNRAELVDLIRTIFHDEFAPIVKSELASLLKSIFMNFVSQPEDHTLLGPVNSPQDKPKLSTNHVQRPLTMEPVEQRGTGYYCLACSCSITSPANLQMHCAGKRHKAFTNLSTS